MSFTDTKMHAVANALAISAGKGIMYRLREDRNIRQARRPVYSVTLKHYDAKRGKHVFTIDKALCEQARTMVQS